MRRLRQRSLAAMRDLATARWHSNRRPGWRCPNPREYTSERLAARETPRRTPRSGGMSPPHKWLWSCGQSSCDRRVLGATRVARPT